MAKGDRVVSFGVFPSFPSSAEGFCLRAAPLSSCRRRSPRRWPRARSIEVVVLRAGEAEAKEEGARTRQQKLQSARCRCD